MGRQSRQSSKLENNLGKGKVTPVQIAFIVDRYLVDNNYLNTLAAFRCEASDLLSKTKGKEAPKGLMGLAEIFDEYITLKERRLMVEQEKRRIEIALGGIGDVMRTYYGAASVATPLSPPLFTPNLNAATPSSSLYPLPGSAGCSPPGLAMEGSNVSQVTSLPPKGVELATATTLLPSSSNCKRKNSKSTNQIQPSSKRSRTSSSKEPWIAGGNTTQFTEKSLESTRLERFPVEYPSHGSSVAKSLFKQQSDIQVHSSPKTPPQAVASQSEKSGSPVDNSSHLENIAANSHQSRSSNCSMLSSQTIIVSPHKGKGYVAIQRSVHVTSSPLKSDTNANRPNKRDQVKGRLDFDSDAPTCSKAQNASDSSPTSTDGEADGCFDFDLPDLDIFNCDFPFSELFVDLDLDCHEGPSQPTSADSSPGTNTILSCEEFATNRALPSSSVPMVAELQSEESNIEGPHSVTTLKTLTKCIIISPEKTRTRSSKLQITESA